MSLESRNLSVRIGRPAADVYAFASNPANLPRWASGLGTSVENVAGRWFMETPDGRAVIAFAERNPFGILDHDVTLPTGEVIHVPTSSATLAWCRRTSDG